MTGCSRSLSCRCAGSGGGALARAQPGGWEQESMAAPACLPATLSFVIMLACLLALGGWPGSLARRRDSALHLPARLPIHVSTTQTTSA